MEIINTNIAELREQRGWSRRELSELMQQQGSEIGETALRRIESGQREVRLMEAMSFAEVFDIPLDTLARERPDQNQAWLAQLLGNVGARQSEVIFGIYELVHALEQLKIGANRIKEKSPDKLPINFEKAEAVLKNSGRYIGKFEAPYAALITLAREVGIDIYDDMSLRFDDIRDSATQAQRQAEAHFHELGEEERYQRGEG